MSETGVVYRGARKEDCSTIGGFIYLASDGLIEFLLHDLIPGVSAEQAYTGLLENEDGYVSFRNTIVAQCNGEVVGAAMSYDSAFHRMDEEKRKFLPEERLNHLTDMFDSRVEGSLFLDALYVKEQYRGKGIGTGLVRLTKQKALKEGFGKVSLIVLADNTVARELYRKNGFDVVKHIRLEPAEFFPHEGGAYLMSSQA